MCFAGGQAAVVARACELRGQSATLLGWVDDVVGLSFAVGSTTCQRCDAGFCLSTQSSDIVLVSGDSMHLPRDSTVVFFHFPLLPALAKKRPAAYCLRNSP